MQAGSHLFFIFSENVACILLLNILIVDMFFVVLLRHVCSFNFALISSTHYLMNIGVGVATADY